MEEQAKLRRFEQTVLPHLGAAYNLARWMTRTGDHAEDVVQEASLRAYRFLDGFRGGDSRAWLLSIVRNTCHSWLRQNRAHEPAGNFDGEHLEPADDAAGPGDALLRGDTQALVREAIEQLPPEFREVVVLREMEGLSYKEIAAVAGVPIGTVMSRLARARERLQQLLSDHSPQGARGPR